MHVHRSILTTAIALVTAAFVAAPTLAHEGEHPPLQRLDFNRPEAWALKYFASATLMAGLEPPRTRDPWSVSFGLEVGWLTPVSEANRFIGFDGAKQEDLNKAPFFARPRLTLGLPGRFALTVGIDPPVRTFGVTPKLVALALERPVHEGGRWIVGMRGYGQVGTIRGAYTCPAAVVRFAPGAPENLYGCEAESSDVATLHFVGAEVSAAYRAARRLSPHAAVAVNYLDLGFHVDALTFGFEDHTRYTARGTTVSGSAGVTWRVTDRVAASFDFFYTPLTVRRAGITRNDPFVNVRALFSYALGR